MIRKKYKVVLKPLNIDLELACEGSYCILLDYFRVIDEFNKFVDEYIVNKDDIRRRYSKANPLIAAIDKYRDVLYVFAAHYDPRDKDFYIIVKAYKLVEVSD